MSPEERAEFDELKRIVNNLRYVKDVPFIENGQKRIAEPLLTDLGNYVVRNSAGGTSGVHQLVTESGSSSYNVADSYNGTIIIEDTNGNTYKLGYYTA